MGKTATKVGTAKSETIRGTRKRDVIVAKGGSDKIYGLGGNDIVCGNGGHDAIFTGGGTNLVAGNAGNDIVIGGPGADSMWGDAGVDGFAGLGGADRYIGGAGADLLTFSVSPQPVEVNLAENWAVGEGQDGVWETEMILGSGFDDSLYGDSGWNIFSGGPGNDYIDGANDSDLAFYNLASSGVRVSLAEGSSHGADGNDTLVSIEDVFGSEFDDVLVGNTSANYLLGAGGRDQLDGRGGADFCDGESVVNCNSATGPVLDEQDVPPPPEGQSPPGRITLNRPSKNVARSAAGGGIGCHPWSGTYTVGFPVGEPGYGFYAVRYDGGNVVTSAWWWSNGRDYWWWSDFARQWNPWTPYQEVYLGGNRIVEGWWWSESAGGWRALGKCLTSQVATGISVVWAGRGGGYRTSEDGTLSRLLEAVGRR